MKPNYKVGDIVTCDDGMDAFDCKATIIAVFENEINVEREDRVIGGGIMHNEYQTWRLTTRDYKYTKIVSRKNEWTGAKRGSFST